MPKPLLLAVVVFGLGCQSTAARPSPRGRFHFPSGIAIDAPYGADAGPAHTLYLAGNTNFDLAYDNGLVFAINLDAIDPAGTGLVPPALANDAGWDGTPLQIPDVDAGGYCDPSTGVVATDSMAGEMRLTTTSDGGGRLFLATRYANLVTAIDVNGPKLDCFGGGSDCNNNVAAPPLVVEQAPGANQLLDVFGVSNEIVTASGERDVFITHMRNQGYGSGGVYSSSAYGNNFNQVGFSYVIRQNVDDPSCRLAEPVGPVGSSSSVALTQNNLIYTLFTGRYGGLTNAVRELTLPAGGCEGLDAGQTAVDANLPNLFTIDLSAITKGNDGRGMTLSSSGDRVFALIRNPDALVVLRNSGFTPAGLLMHPSAAIPLPPGPTQLLAIPRTSPNGTPIGDLVVVTCADSGLLAFYDDEIGTVTAAIPGVGDEPFGVASAVRSLGTGPGAKVLPGARLFVSAFGSGQVAVVDIPDLLDARTAQTVAFIGTREDTTTTPINPNSTLFQTPIGGGPTGIP